MPTKTDRVAREIVGAILRGQYAPGDVAPSERELMRRTGTSRVTVRRAYAELASRGILERRQGSGAYISTSLRGNAQRPDAMVVLASPDDLFALEFIDALERSASEAGCLLAIRQRGRGARREAAVAAELLERGVRNLVVWASGEDYDARLFGRLRILGMNMVFFDRMRPGAFADYVGTDNAHGIAQLAGAARKGGARRLVYVDYAAKPWSIFLDRRAAFEEYCRRRRVPGRVVEVPWSDRAAHLLGGRDVLGTLADEPAAKVLGRRAGEWFAGRDEAVICANDYVALQVRQACPSARVYGFDGLREATASGIVTYRHAMGEMAAAAVQMLSEQQQSGARWKARERLFRGRLVMPA